MSNTQFVFISKTSIPNREHLQSSINELGFDLLLDPDFKPLDDEGYSPCVLNGEADVGFEIFYEPSAEVCEEDEELKSIALDNDYCMSLCWGGSFKDLACVMIVSCALAKDFGGYVSYEGEPVESLEKMIQNAREAMKQAEVEERKQQQAKIYIEDAKKNGNIEGILKKELNELIGTKVSNISLFGNLTMQFSNAYVLMAKAFLCQTSNEQILDVTQFSRIRAQQMALLIEAEGEDLTQTQQQRLEELQTKADKAMDLDESHTEHFMIELKSWPEELIVESAILSSKETVTLKFCNLPNVYIQMHAIDSMTADIHMRTGLVNFKISPDGCEILG